MTRIVTLLLLIMSSSACVSTRDVSHWLLWEKPIQVTEVRRSQDCASPDAQTHVYFFDTLASVQAWELSRQLNLTGEGAALTEGPYALIELGRQNTAGYGLAVSRLAGRHSETLTLKATFISPAQGTVQAEMITSPCVLVRLPPRPYSGVEVVDQTGALRASSSN